MESGVLIHVEGSWAHTEFGSSLEITGSEGMLVENLSDSMPLTLNERSGPGMLPAVAVPDMSLQRSSYERELLHFTKCLLSGEEPEVTAYDAMKAIAIARAAIQSAQTGVPVKLNAEEVQSLDSE
jgi:UDP-N-acetylglucosamine 3-dehydrogenase